LDYVIYLGEKYEGEEKKEVNVKKGGKKTTDKGKNKV
jgi:hypothetical protein